MIQLKKLAARVSAEMVVLEKELEEIKKTTASRPTNLSNRVKTIVVDAVRSAFCGFHADKPGLAWLTDISEFPANPTSLVIHSDQGCHYRVNSWIDPCHDIGFVRSMPKGGCPPDNAACEGFVRPNEK
ncbi:hypothetical protein [Corynebacterium propinquum]